MESTYDLCALDIISVCRAIRIGVFREKRVDFSEKLSRLFGVQVTGGTFDGF